MIITDTVARGGATLEIRDGNNPGFVQDKDRDDAIIADFLRIPAKKKHKEHRAVPAVVLEEPRVVHAVIPEEKPLKRGKKPRRTADEMRRIIRHIPLPQKEIGYRNIAVSYRKISGREYLQLRYRFGPVRTTLPEINGVSVKEMQCFWSSLINEEIKRRSEMQRKEVA
ncbi:MAG: hypothetical protein HGA87_01365 [Desulfobulbaceae bacterium]|nr:hypothetical protein [Desulfobulbaceae bacterium]